MKVISTNLGQPVVIEWNGEMVPTGIYKYEVPGPLFLGAGDVENDHVMDRRHHGGRDKACYLYPADHYAYWKTVYPELEMPWGMFGENLTVEGLHEGHIGIGDEFQLGEAVVQVTQPRQPCFKLGVRFHDPAMAKNIIASGFPGVYLRVLKNGKVAKGDELIPIKARGSLTVQKIFELLFTDAFQKEAVEQAVADTFLAESCRRDLLKKWKNFL